MTTKIGFVGVGDISWIYLKNITQRFKNLEVAGVCDLIPEKAQKANDMYGVKVYNDMYALFADEQVDIVLNLTRPYEHYDVTKAALLAGKHVYCEKPLAATWEEGKELVALAKEKGLRLGGAPDTFLGAGIQGCRAFIEEGLIGRPVGFAAHMLCHGHETWHPDPEFYYKHGGGPMLDMGPYYVTALVQCMGPVKGVMAMTEISFATRTITSERLHGTIIDVDVPTHYNCLLRFASGATGTLVTSFDVFPMPGVRNIEIYGELGNISVPDPNNFGGEIAYKLGKDDFAAIDTPFEAYGDNSRGLGLADMAQALQEGRPARAGCDLTLHVLEVLTALRRSSESGREVVIESNYAVQASMPQGEAVFG